MPVTWGSGRGGLVLPCLVCEREVRILTVVAYRSVAGGWGTCQEAVVWRCSAVHRGGSESGPSQWVCGEESVGVAVPSSRIQCSTL